MTEQYISIRQIMDDLMVHPLLRDITLETLVRHTVNFMRIVGAHFVFTDSFETLEVKDYKAQLPCDFFEMIQVKEDRTGKCMRYATSTFIQDLSNMKREEQMLHKQDDMAYKIQGGVLYCTERECKIRISYRAIKVDEDGYPLLPDNSVFVNALEAYIKKQHFTILFDLAKIPLNVFQQSQQDYAWAVGQCHVEGDRLSLDRMQTLSNSLNTLLSRPMEHSKSFDTLGSQEQRYIH